MPATNRDGVVLYIDGGSRGNPGPAAYGVVVKDAAGNPLTAFSKFLGRTTNNVAEYEGLLAGLDYALSHHRSKVKVCADSELMVRQIQGRYKVKSADLKPLHERARQMIGRLEDFSIEHVRREQNREADRLVNQALDAAEEKKGNHQDTKTPSHLDSIEQQHETQNSVMVGTDEDTHYRGPGRLTEPIPAQLDMIASKIVDAAFAVHSKLGPGLLESVYETCLLHEIKKRELSVERQVEIPIDYDGIRLEAGLRIDLLVDKRLIVELKSVDSLSPVHTAQMLTYLKLSGQRLGLLINFNVPLIRNGIKRIVL
ncbi:MAG: GxxExxY protein [Acidobacteria bacterium]|nr:GxxExxY protein [Acidobacteriota bacterium]